MNPLLFRVETGTRRSSTPCVLSNGKGTAKCTAGTRRRESRVKKNNMFIEAAVWEVYRHRSSKFKRAVSMQIVVTHLWFSKLSEQAFSEV